MKVGAQDKRKLYAMVALLAVAALLVLRAFIVGAGTAQVAASAPAQTAAQAGGGTHGNSTAPLDPTLRVDLLRNSEGAAYKGSGRNIFEAQAAPPPVVPKPKPSVPEPTITANQGPPAPPPPPPIPLKFFGFANEPGQPKSIFLANGDDIFIGHEGDIVNRRYKILRISATQVEIEDVLNNHRETIPLTQG